MRAMKRAYDWWIGEYWAQPAKAHPAWMSRVRYYWRKLKWALIRWAIVPNAEGTLTGYYSNVKVEGWIF